MVCTANLIEATSPNHMSIIPLVVVTGRVDRMGGGR